MRLLLIIVFLLCCNDCLSQTNDCYLIGGKPNRQLQIAINDSLDKIHKRYAGLGINLQGVDYYWIEPKDLVLKRVDDNKLTKFLLDMSNFKEQDSLKVVIKSFNYEDLVIKYKPEIQSWYTLTIKPSDSLSCKTNIIRYKIAQLNTRQDTMIMIHSTTLEPSTPKPPNNPKSGDIWEITAFGQQFEMVYVEGGSFMMGVNENELKNLDQLKHREYVDDFWISKYEVTNRQWNEYWKRIKPKNTDWITRWSDCLDCPVTCVEWDEANTFCGILGEEISMKEAVGIPMEKEWEFAAKGGINQDTYIYSGSDSLELVAWTYSNSSICPHEVDSKEPNSLGIYGMTGNANEWCFESDTVPSRKPTGKPYVDAYYYRGGSFQRLGYLSDDLYKITHRERYQDPYAEDLGFRFVIRVGKKEEELQAE